ncbi:MAG: ArsR family transcriptional regulator [Rhodobacterales bacterium]|nr:ArsR family transcriptional regulator [Rhodobacterales bacterium]
MQAKLNELFSALSDATRREILIMLLEDDMAVTDVAHPFDMSLPAISKHLNILSNAGLITQERRGRVNWCKLEPDGLREASVWMLSFGQFDIPDIEGLRPPSASFAHGGICCFTSRILKVTDRFKKVSTCLKICQNGYLAYSVASPSKVLYQTMMW